LTICRILTVLSEKEAGRKEERKDDGKEREQREREK
jgi:hypothetical protein